MCRSIAGGGLKINETQRDAHIPYLECGGFESKRERKSSIVVCTTDTTMVGRLVFSYLLDIHAIVVAGQRSCGASFFSSWRRRNNSSGLG